MPDLPTSGADWIPLRQASREERILRQEIRDAIAAGRIAAKQGKQPCGNRNAPSHCRLVLREDCKRERMRLDGLALLRKYSQPIPITHAFRKYGISPQRIKQLIETGELKHAYIDGEHIVSGREIKKLVLSEQTSEAMPEGFQPLYELSDQLGLDRATVEYWCNMPSHLALGRKIDSGYWRTKDKKTTNEDEAATYETLRLHRCARRSDIVACQKAIASPTAAKIGDNPGTWITIVASPRREGQRQGAIEGVFVHDDGQVFLTARTAERRAGLSENALSHKFHLNKLEPLSVIAPTPKGLRRIKVYSEKSVACLKLWRDGKTDSGSWIAPNEFWSDADGLWISRTVISRRLPNFSWEVAELRRNGVVTRSKRVPRNQGIMAGQEQKRRKAGSSLMVFHLNEIGPLIGLAACATQGVDEEKELPATSEAKKNAGRPKGTKSKERERRVKAMLDAWDRGEFATKAEAGKAYGFKRSNASVLINEHDATKAYK